MTHVWANTTYPPAQSYILQAIADVVNDTHDNRLFMKIETLAKKTKCSDRTIQRALRQFVADGWLSLLVDNQGRGTPNEYQFNFLKGDNLAGQERVTGEDQKGDNEGSERVTDSVSIPLLELNNNSIKTQLIEELRLATLLADLIEQNGSKRPNVTKRWVNAIDLMVRVDKRTYLQIENAIRWSQSNNWWRAVILSPHKLREKYDQMRLIAVKETPTRGHDVMVQELAKETAKETAQTVQSEQLALGQVG